MSYKCVGCGIELQNTDRYLLGYVDNLDKKLCERCFRIRNYNEYQKVEKETGDFYSVVDIINNTNDLVVLIVDIICIGNELFNFVSKLKNKPFIAISKRDLFSYKVKDEKICSIIDVPSIDKIVFSSKNNYNLDLLMEKIDKYRTSDNVYIVGLTNSGKSTLINKIIYNYTDLNLNITTSMLPSTTLSLMEIPIKKNLTIIDTPGIVDTGNICNYLSVETLKKVYSKKEIKPITYQMKLGQYIYIEDILKIDFIKDCDATFFISNSLKIERKYKDSDTNLFKRNFEIKNKSIIIINGLGFILLNKKTNINLYTYENVEITVKSV